MDSILNEFDTTSEKIKALIGGRGDSYKDLAELLGVTSETIGNRMSANRWAITDVEKIAVRYGIDAVKLLNKKER